MSLQRRIPLNPVGRRKRAESDGPVWSTFRPRPVAGQREPRTPAPKRPRDTGPDQATVIAVLERDGHACFRCGGAAHGVRGVDWSVQHRRARGNGGSRRPDTNAPQNLIILCGSATSPGGCHLRTESARTEARDNGWAIRQSQDPLQVPVTHWLHGIVWLLPDGGWTSTRPAVAS